MESVGVSDKDSVLKVYRVIRCHPPEDLQFSCRVRNFSDIVRDGCRWVYYLRAGQDFVDRVEDIVIVEWYPADDIDNSVRCSITQIYACRIAISREFSPASDADALAHERAV